MYKAEIVDYWTTGTDGAKYPSVHGRVLGWADVTGQQVVIPPVNALVVEVLCRAAQLDALEADDDLVVLWSEEIIDDEA